MLEKSENLVFFNGFGPFLTSNSDSSPKTTSDTPLQPPKRRPGVEFPEGTFFSQTPVVHTLNIFRCLSVYLQIYIYIYVERERYFSIVISIFSNIIVYCLVSFYLFVDYSMSKYTNR